MGKTGASDLLWASPPHGEGGEGDLPASANDGPPAVSPELQAALDRVNAAWPGLLEVCPAMLRKAAGYAWGRFELDQDPVEIAKFATWMEELAGDIASARYLHEKICLAGREPPVGLEPRDFTDKDDRAAWKKALDDAWKRYGNQGGGTLPASQGTLLI